MSSQVPILSSKQLLAAQALASGLGIGEAAVMAGVSEKTVDRWLKLPEFQDAINEIKRYTYNSAIARVVDACTIAVEALKEIAADKGTSANARVSASKAILDSSYRGYAQAEIEARISELEAQANNART